MPQSFLEMIRPEVVASVERLKQERGLAEWEERALQRKVKASFRQAVSSPDGVNIIAEIKKASPSLGIIRKDVDPLHLASIYETHGACAISVLTEERHFLGSIQTMGQIAILSSLPILRKDFILDEVQIAQGRSNGAAAILLIVAFLKEAELCHLLSACKKYGVDALVEVHDEEEFQKASDAGATIIGVNNRNLKTLEVDLSVSERLARLKQGAQIFVAESGLTSPEQLRHLKSMGYNAFLIGEHLMKSADPGLELENLRGADDPC